MKGDDKVLDALADVLMEELTGINMYYIHYKMQENWGYKKLAHHSRGESMEEMKHGDKVIERILFLEGVPNMGKYDEVLVGDTCEEQLKNEHKRETDYIARLKNHIALCIEKSDFVTKELLDEVLEDAEEQVDWLETQFQRISDIGIENYLTEHMHD